MATEISFLVGLFFIVALGAGVALFVVSAIEWFIGKMTEFFNG